MNISVFYLLSHFRTNIYLCGYIHIYRKIGNHIIIIGTLLQTLIQILKNF